MNGWPPLLEEVGRRPKEVCDEIFVIGVVNSFFSGSNCKENK